MRLGKLTGRTDYLDAADKTLRLFADLMQKHPMTAAQMLIAFDFAEGPTPELVLLGDRQNADVARVLADLRRRFWPNKVVAARPTEHESAALAPLFEGKRRLRNQARGKSKMNRYYTSVKAWLAKHRPSEPRLLQPSLTAVIK